MIGSVTIVRSLMNLCLQNADCHYGASDVLNLETIRTARPKLTAGFCWVDQIQAIECTARLTQNEPKLPGHETMSLDACWVVG